MIAPRDLLSFASLFTGKTQPEAAIRRAISSAYYAVFHTVAEAGAASFSGSARVRRRLARSYDHGAVRSMATEMARTGKQPGADPDLLVVANSLDVLRDAREQADYDLDANLTWIDCLDCVVLATEAMAAIARLTPNPTFGELLLLPLLRDRSRRG